MFLTSPVFVPSVSPIQARLCSHAPCDPQTEGCPLHMPAAKNSLTAVSAATQSDWIFIQQQQACGSGSMIRAALRSRRATVFSFSGVRWAAATPTGQLEPGQGVCVFAFTHPLYPYLLTARISSIKLFLFEEDGPHLPTFSSFI